MTCSPMRSSCPTQNVFDFRPTLQARSPSPSQPLVKNSLILRFDRAKYDCHPTARVRISHPAQRCEVFTPARNSQPHPRPMRKRIRDSREASEQTQVVGSSLELNSGFRVGHFNGRGKRLADCATAFGLHGRLAGFLRFKNVSNPGMPGQTKKVFV